MTLDPILIVKNSFIVLSEKLWSFTVSSIYAFIILIIGYIVGKLVWKFFDFLFGKVIDVDSVLKKKKLDKFLYGYPVSKLLSTLVKWYIYLIFLSQALYVFDYEPFINAGYYIYYYLPLVYEAIGIIIIGAFFGEIMKNFLQNLDLPRADRISSLVKFLVLYISFAFSLGILGINVSVLWKALYYSILAFAITSSVSAAWHFVNENKKFLKF